VHEIELRPALASMLVGALHEEPL
jgi:hypothetical protein